MGPRRPRAAVRHPLNDHQDVTAIGIGVETEGGTGGGTRGAAHVLLMFFFGVEGTQKEDGATTKGLIVGVSSVKSKIIKRLWTELAGQGAGGAEGMRGGREDGALTKPRAETAR